MKSNLIERYIYAVVRRLPEKERKDVSLELDELISAMLEERSGVAEASEEQVRAVLTELGKPDELAHKYGGVAQSCLIGEPHFSLYKRVLKIVLFAVAGALTLALLTEWIVENPGAVAVDLDSLIVSIHEGIMHWTSTVADGLLSAFAAVTITFAVLYHQGVKMDKDEFNLDDLPDVPRHAASDGIAGLIGSLVFISIFTVLFVLLPHINIPVFFLKEKLISFFNADVLIAIRPILVVSIMTSLIDAVVRAFQPYGSIWRFLATLLANVMNIISTIVWFGNPEAVNPEFARHLLATTGWNITGFNGEPLPGVMGKWAMIPLPLMIALIVIIVVSVVETVNEGVKMSRTRQI